jgi:outer membrane scaffolding protein for murein synthesis (MipA/OmpV family)
MLLLRLLIATALPMALLVTGAVQAQARSADADTTKTDPLWEAGAGLATAWLPDYRGSDEARGYLLPFPWFIYRGEFLKADREGVRAQFFDSKYMELDVSFGATVPVRNTKNRARAGMPSLKPTLEAGPVLQFHLYRSERGERGRDLEVDLRLPVRRAFSWEGGNVRDIGTLAFPNLNVDRRIDMLGSRWNLGLVLGAYYGDRRYHDYFYGVEPAYATATRPAYEARGGYGGTQAIVALSSMYGRWWVGGFLRFDRVRGAIFDDSPLMRRDHHVAGGVGVAWVFAESERRVPR